MDNLSPNPTIIDVETSEPSLTMDFPNAIREISKGNKVTRLAWKPEISFGMMKEGFLTIFINGEFHRWMVNDGDLDAVDWVLYPEEN